MYARKVFAQPLYNELCRVPVHPKCFIAQIMVTHFMSRVAITITNTPTHAASPPTIVEYQQKVLCLEGEQVTLTVKVAGSPTPTITWLFNGKKVKDDYSTEVGKDGSLTLTCVELKHAGTYTFSVSNSVGSVEGCTKLVVHTEDEDCTSAPKVESNPVAKETFGEYVSSLHAHNNGGFTAQYQVIACTSTL